MGYYERSSIFWHATGFGTDPEKSPEKMEHFGITTVEAMSHGLIPIVFQAGGQAEIIEHRKDGFLWKTKEECIKYTFQVMKDDELRNQMSLRAIEKAKKYSVEKFIQNSQKMFMELLG